LVLLAAGWHAAACPADADAPAAVDLAVPANGQAVHCLDPRDGRIVALDPFSPSKRRVVLDPAAPGGPIPVAIDCIDTNTLVAVCRAGEEWSLRTWRIEPHEAADPGAPLQAVPLGSAAGPAGAVHVAVSPSRDWLAISGLPAPLAPVLRAAIAGARIGRVTARSCPSPPEGVLPVAVTVTPADELVVFEVAVEPSGGAADGEVAFHALTGRQLLRLGSVVPNIRDAAYGRGDGTLWVIGGDRSSREFPEGLWRLDAAMEAGRQVIRPVCVLKIAAPRAVACVAETAVVVAHGDSSRSFARFDLDPKRADQQPAPGKAGDP
jgi:hypothetical protein